MDVVLHARSTHEQPCDDGWTIARRVQACITLRWHRLCPRNRSEASPSCPGGSFTINHKEATIVFRAGSARRLRYWVPGYLYFGKLLSAPASLNGRSSRRWAHWGPLSTYGPKVRVKIGARVAESQISAAGKVSSRHFTGRSRRAARRGGTRRVAGDGWTLAQLWTTEAK